MLEKELLEYSYKRGFSHIPSALSMLDYVYELFANNLVTPDDIIMLGKPFGAQAYYVVWEKLGYLRDISKLSAGVKHDEIPFVYYAEETMGNALGVAAGVAISTNKLIWVNISDATLQMGSTLEAIQFIGHHQLSNILVTIDYNNHQVLGDTDQILTVDPILEMFEQYGWWLDNDFEDFHVESHPKVFVMNTIKGNGVPEMIQNPVEWHYRKIASEEELERLCALL